MALNDQDKPRRPVPDLDQVRAAMNVVSELARDALRSTARSDNGILAELGRIAALAILRLDQANDGQSTAERDLTAVKGMLQEIETASHQAYLVKHGSEEDYQAIGAKIEKKRRTPSGRWRGQEKGGSGKTCPPKP